MCNQRWSDQSDSALQDCFSATEWCGVQDNTYTDTVICYICKCIDDVVPRISVRTFPKQKPWTGDLEEYRKSRYTLWSAVSIAKRHYRDKVESHYKGSNTRNMWAGLKTISDYKGKTSSADVVSASLPEELNTFMLALRATPRLWSYKRPRRAAAPLYYPWQISGDHLSGLTHARHLDLMASLVELSR